RHCLCQQHCVCAQGCYWKDLSRLGRELDKLVALPAAPHPLPPPQAANWIPVPRWCGDLRDQELLQLLPVLAQLGREVRSGGRGGAD
ncbi:CTSL2 protein, partial [Psilopogon haemacephalus]|nr:CTSL2 protein [Psilopogon haemacephalus]